MSRYIDLSAELSVDPLKRGYEGMTAAAAAADLNAAYRLRRKERAMLDERGVLALLGPTLGESAMQKLENAAASQGGVLARAVRWLKGGVGQSFDTAGLDFADPVTHAMLDQLTAAGVLSSDEIEPLKAHGLESISRAIEVWGIPVTEADVAHARSL